MLGWVLSLGITQCRQRKEMQASGASSSSLGKVAQGYSYCRQCPSPSCIRASPSRWARAPYARAKRADRQHEVSGQRQGPGRGTTVRLHAMPHSIPSFWRRGMPRSQIQKSMMMPKTKPITRPSSMSACVPSETSSMTRSNRRVPSPLPPTNPTGAPSLFCSSHSSSSSTDSRSESGRPLCARREWNCVRRISTSVGEKPARSL